MSKQSFPSLQADDAFNITVSDTVNISGDANNTKGYKFCFVHNKGVGGLVKVTTVNGTDITVYINQGATCELAVSRVWSTGTDSGITTTLVAFVGKG